METKELLTEDRIRADLKTSIKQGCIDRILASALLSLPLLLLALFTLLAEAYGLALVCVVPLIVILLFVAIPYAIVCRRYRRMPITLCEKPIDGVESFVHATLSEILCGFRFDNRRRSFFVFHGQGRTVIPENLRHLGKGDSCYLLKDLGGNIVLLYSAASYRPAEGLSVEP